MRKYLIISAVGVVALAASFILGSIRGKNKAISAMKDKMDTLYVHDTLREEMPVPVTEWRDRIYYVEVPAWDTVHIHHHDTTFIGLPLEHKEYKSANYLARISGYQPNLDYIETYQETKTIFVEKPATPDKKPFYVGVEGEFAYDWSNHAFAPVSVIGGYDIGWLDFSIGGGYDFMAKQPMVKASLRFLPLHWK